MRILAIVLTVLLPSIVLAQTVSRTELRNTNNAILTTVGSRAASSNANFVRGPGSATDNAIAIFDSTTGKLIKNSPIIVDPTGDGAIEFSGQSRIYHNTGDDTFWFTNEFNGDGFILGNGRFDINAGIFGPSGTFTSFFQLPTSTNPTTDAFGELAGDSNTYGAGRGTLKYFDGTDSAYIVGTVTSSTPSNGQVPKYNSASGTVTWQDDNNDGGTGTPDGDSGAIQFNEGDAFAGTNDFIWNRTNKTLVVRNQDLTGSKYIYFAGSSLTAPDFSIQAGTNEFILQPDFGSSGTYLRANKSGKWIGIGTTANNLGTNWGDWYFPSNVAMGTASIIGTGSPQHTFGGGATNYSTKLADSSVTLTNLVGLRHVTAAAVIEFDANKTHRLNATNRIGAATSIILTNTADGQELRGTVLGEASGGSARTVTLVPHLGQLVTSMDDTNAAIATSFAFSLPAGNGVEFNDSIERLNGTNFHKIVTRHFKF